jgi:hypothetical protein
MFYEDFFDCGVSKGRFSTDGIDSCLGQEPAGEMNYSQLSPS